MEWLQTLLDSSTTPALTAFLLGLLTAISPCPLATNIAAIGFISKDIENRLKYSRDARTGPDSYDHSSVVSLPIRYWVSY